MPVLAAHVHAGGGVSGAGAWRHTVLARLAAELTRPQYEALILRWHDKSYEDIGEILGVTKQAAYGLVKRAEKNARKIAEEEQNRDRKP